MTRIQNDAKKCSEEVTERNVQHCVVTVTFNKIGSRHRSVVYGSHYVVGMVPSRALQSTFHHQQLIKSYTVGFFR